LDRFTCIVLKPFANTGLGVKTTISLVIICWILGTLFFTTLFSDKKLTNSICSFIGSSLPVAMQISFLGYYISLSTIMAVLNVAIMYKVVKSNKVTKSKKDSSMYNVLLRLGVIILVNCISCSSLGAMLMIAMLSGPLQEIAEIYVSLMLFPLIAMLNPIINTITTPDFKAHWQAIFHRGRQHFTDSEIFKKVSQT
jgi:hypothetical protein